MKKLLLCVGLVLMSVTLFVSCGSTSNITTTRVDSGTVVDLTGFWNETDVTTVSNSCIQAVMVSPRISAFYEKNGRLPVFTLGKIANESDEHIDTSIVANKLRNAIINSGRADFVANIAEKGAIRDEREDQSIWGNVDQAKSLANEDAADFMVQGSIRTIIQKNGGKSVRQYYVDIELVDIETGRIIFSHEDSSIKKLVSQSTIKW